MGTSGTGNGWLCGETVGAGVTSWAMGVALGEADPGGVGGGASDGASVLSDAAGPRAASAPRVALQMTARAATPNSKRNEAGRRRITGEDYRTPLVATAARGRGGAGPARRLVEGAFRRRVVARILAAGRESRHLGPKGCHPGTHRPGPRCLSDARPGLARRYNRTDVVRSRRSGASPAARGATSLPQSRREIPYGRNC